MDLLKLRKEVERVEVGGLVSSHCRHTVRAETTLLPGVRDSVKGQL